ncbi:MAG TPA: PQQ-binding-like beta-propeller repeat protein, partial [Ktedonobacterales bacterium]|nr:PQQ-binding-like beta-propeller repeat protein [Ktedonobacterales bacterium]
SITGGHYNWSSPLIYNNYAYIGVASNCDLPLVQGQLLQVDLTTHQIVNTANFVPNGEVGGGIWSSPSLDTATNTIFVTTGTQAQTNELMAQAVVALDASTLAIKSYWQIPLNERGNDSDWGTTPLLFTDATGRQLVAAVNKNGVLYAFLRSNLAAGPVWRQQIAIGGECPQCGDGGISSGAFANGVLYYAAGNTTINGVGYAGSVRAFDPATGNILWAHGDEQPVFAAIAYDNGLIFDGVGNTLEALDASNGARLYSFTTAGPIYSAPSISNGSVYFGSIDKNVYSLALPATIPTILPDPHCPAGWTCQDINASTLRGFESISNGTWTVTAAGAGIRGSADQFRLISQPATGDAQVSARLLTEPTSNSAAQSGVIMRQSNDPGSPFYAVLEYPNDTPDGVASPTLRVLYRSAFGGALTQAIRISPTTLPVYVMIQRVGDAFIAATSTDGVNYHIVPASRVVLPLPATVLAGNAIDSGSAMATVTDTYAQPSIGAPTTQLQQAAMPSPCPANWNCYDVDNTSPVGSQTLSSAGQWTLLSTGATMSSYTDQFHFVYQSLSGDGSIQAHVASQTNTAAGARAGVLLRQSLDPGSAYYGVFVTPGNGIVVQYRAITGLHSAVVTTIAGAAPAYLRVTRYTDTSVSPAITYYAAYTSSDGVTWTFVPWSAEAISMGSTTLVGMAASTYANGTQSTVVMDTVSVSSATTPPPTLCPSSWSCGDIGYPDVAGAQNVSNGVFQVSGTGNDIWDTYDQFHYVWQTLAGDGVLSAHITAQTNPNPWAKAGLMLRATSDPSSPYYAALITPSNGLAVQYRSASGGPTSQIQYASITTLPLYLEAARYTDTSVSPAVTYYSTYTSSDGVTWSLLAGSTVGLAMSGALQAGLAVTSHNGDGAASVATYDTVALGTTAPIPPTICPATFSCGDIGAATPTGSQTLSNGTWTIQGGGGDIWGTADSFHYVWQTLAADGSVSAQVTSQSNTDGWAKAGVMLRASNAANAPYYAIYLTPSNGLAVQYRATAGGSAGQAVQVTTTTAPLYLKVTRIGTTFTAYTSPDGVTWTLVEGSTVTLSNLSGSALAGLAVTSHNSSALSTAVFN